MLTYVLVVASLTTSPGDSYTTSLALSDVTTLRSVTLPARGHHGDFLGEFSGPDFKHNKNSQKVFERNLHCCMICHRATTLEFLCALFFNQGGAPNKKSTKVMHFLKITTDD